jgi:hypothetical protein
VAERLDEERIEALRQWAARLATDTVAELRAAGKAITMLLDERDQLQADLGRARRTSNTPTTPVSDAEEALEPVEPASSQSLGLSLRERLGAAIPRIAAPDREE